MLNDDIQEAQKLLTAYYIGMGIKFKTIYPFTNEDIKGYFDHFDFKGKDVLTVLASSDQVFDMFLRGAKSISTFDKNPLSKYYFYLKKAAVLALEKKDFIKFFNHHILSNDGRIIYNYYTFDKDMFKEICKYLKGNSYVFWNTLYEIFAPEDISKEQFLLDFDYHNEFNLINQTLYFSEDNFEILKSKINSLKITFKKCDITDLPTSLNKMFDIIYLSNIMRFSHGVPNDISSFSIHRFIDFLNDLSKHLNDDGNILACYCYQHYILPFMEELRLTGNSKIKSITFNDSTAIVYKK